MDFGFTGVAAITVVCYLIALIIRTTPLDKKWLPIICGVLGGIFGVAGMQVVPNFPAADLLSAAAVGIVSGLAATGANQVYKQLSGK